MDPVVADLTIQAILGRSADFVGGIDNEALDFSQLEDFINSEGSQSTNTYFSESLNSTTTTTTTNNPQQPQPPPPPPPLTTTTTTTNSTSGKLLNVIVENKRNLTNNNNNHNNNNNINNGHSLPESPPDSSSEHPYSPPDDGTHDNIYTQLGQTIYKPTTTTTTTTILNPMLTDNLILGSHIVVTNEQNNNDLIDNGIIVNHQNDPTNLLITDETNRQLLLNGTNGAGGGGNGGAGEQNNYPNNYKNEDYVEKNHLVHLGYATNHTIDVTRNNLNTLCEPTTLDNIQNVYTNLQNVSKKRKLSQDSPLVKSEPEHCPTSQLSPIDTLTTPLDEEYASSEACLSESQYQCIRFSSFQQNQWHTLCDQNLSEIPVPQYRVDADKGFNFSNADDAFVCQKKNHFQITCHVQLFGDAQFVKTPDGFQKISSFHLHFYGVKHDCPTQTIRVEQSQSDRSKKPFHPVLVELANSQVTKITVGRLHFSETTSNNMRKKGKPNPEQRYFQLVVGLHAHTTNGNFPVVSHASQKIIVRASNPGQFESDVELCWQKGQTQDSVYHNGKVGINMDRPDESLVVHGNIKVTGHIVQPSDIRAKKNIIECDPAEQLRNVQKLRIVRYEYEPSFASKLSNEYQQDTGVIAQEVAKILPEAVRPAGNLILENGTAIDNFLVVNKERIFMENIGAVKELCRVTDNLETRIDQLERINRRLNKLKRGDSLKSNSTVNSSKLSYQKCQKHHCNNSKDDEFCSNKFIQIVIVVLVLIMAFCLAAITTLYLMEASRRSQLTTNLQATHRNAIVTKRPIKSKFPHHNSNSNNNNNWHTISPQQKNKAYQGDEITKLTVDSSFIKRPSFIIGRPNECLTVEQDLESTNLCQIYCCVSPPVIPEIYERKQTIIDTNNNNLNRNKTGLLNLEKNKVTKPFHSNDIDKIRQKRDSGFDLVDDISLETNDDELFQIRVQGKNFSALLTRKYLSQLSSTTNFSYTVPISKYMPDDFINLIFRSTQTNKNIMEIEYCDNDLKQNECPFINPNFYDNNKNQQKHRVNENTPSQILSSKSVIFEVDMADFQSKTMTYRVALRPNQSMCKLSSTKLGLEYLEYNFHFYRHCDE